MIKPDFDLDAMIAGTLVEPRPYQRRIAKKVLDMFGGHYRNGAGDLEGAAKSVMVESPTGCLVGDTQIVVNVGGKSRRLTLRQAYLHFHGGDPAVPVGKCGCGCGENTRVPHKSNATKGQIAGVPLRFVHGHQSRVRKWEGRPRVRAFRGERGIGLQPIVNVVQSGVKTVYDLSLVGIAGPALTGTACHPIMTRGGWVKLGDLRPGDEVMVDSIRPTRSDDARGRTRDKHLTNMWNHPYGRRVITAKMNCGYTVRVPKHVAAYEAHVNGLTMGDYAAVIRGGDPSGLTLVDPSVHVVHHKNRDHSDDSPGNLELLTHSEHNKLHGREDHYRNFGQATPKWATVDSVVVAGTAMTYDVCCEQPYHNFVANGIVVHNSGKTVMALTIAKSVQEQTGAIVAWVSMRKNLLKQAGYENLPPSPENPSGKAIGAHVEFLSMFTREIPDYTLPEKRGSRPLLFIHDEAQHDAAASAAHLHNEFKPDWVLGLSATPYRSDLVKLPFEKVVKDAGIHELIQGGYLSEYDHYGITDWDPDTVADFWHSNPERWGPSLIFFQDLDRCRRCLSRLNSYGHRFDLVTGQTDREEQIDQLRAGELDGLINCAVLTEGFNFPDLKTVWVRDSGKGCTIQMGGRVFRKSALNRFKQVVQSKETRWPMQKTATPHQQFVWQGDDWRTLTVNPRIEATADDTRQALANMQDEVPRYLKDRMGKKRRNRF